MDGGHTTNEGKALFRLPITFSRSLEVFTDLSGRVNKDRTEALVGWPLRRFAEMAPYTGNSADECEGSGVLLQESYVTRF